MSVMEMNMVISANSMAGIFQGFLIARNITLCSKQYGIALSWALIFLYFHHCYLSAVVFNVWSLSFVFHI